MKYNSVGYQPGDASHLISVIQQIQAPSGVTLTMDSARAVVGRGLSLLFDLTLKNLGSFTETFNTTAYANTITVYTKQVPLTSGNSTTISFVWDTTGFAYGNYTMSACAMPVSGETNTTDDTVFGGRVVITIPGDINGDFNVGLTDLVILAQAYGSRPGDSKWNINADIDGNSAVGLSDLVILAQHYGQHYP